MAVLEDGSDAAGSGGEDWRIGEAEIGAETGLDHQQVFDQASSELT